MGVVMTVQWSDALRVGNAEIDAQHVELFRRVNLLLDMTDTLSLTKCLISLFKFTREHSSYEEDLMRKTHFPDIFPHLFEHNELLNQLNRVAESIANESFIKKDWQEFFEVWLIKHIEASDRPLVAFLQTVHS
jgi:hemerythrin